MDAIAWFATHFIGLFNEAAKSLLGLITGILPLLLVLLTAMYAVTSPAEPAPMTTMLRSKDAGFGQRA